MVFSCGKTRPIPAFKLLKESSSSPSGWRPCFRPLFLGRNYDTSFQALSCLLSKMMKPPCVTGEDVTNKVVAFDSIHQLWGNAYFAEFFAAPSAKKKNFPQSPGQQCVLFQSVLPFLWHVSILSDELNFCSFVSMDKGISRAYSTGLTGEVFIPSFKYIDQRLTMTDSAHSSPYSHRNSVGVPP